jgi:hypothetical protein
MWDTTMCVIRIKSMSDSYDNILYGIVYPTVQVDCENVQHCGIKKPTRIQHILVLHHSPQLSLACCMTLKQGRVL